MKSEKLANMVKKVTMNKKISTVGIYVKDGKGQIYSKIPSFIGLIRWDTTLPDMNILLESNKIIDVLNMMDEIEIEYNDPSISIIDENIKVERIPTLKIEDKVPLDSFKDGVFYYKKGTEEPQYKMEIYGDSVIAINSSNIEKDLPDYIITKSGEQKVFDSFNPTQYEIKKQLDIINKSDDMEDIFIRDNAPDIFRIIKELKGVWNISWTKGYPVCFRTKDKGIEYMYLIAQVISE